MGVPAGGGRKEGEEGGGVDGQADGRGGPGVHPAVPCTLVQAGPHTCRSRGTAASAQDKRDDASRKDARTWSGEVLPGPARAAAGGTAAGNEDKARPRARRRGACTQGTSDLQPPRPLLGLCGGGRGLLRTCAHLQDTRQAGVLKPPCTCDLCFWAPSRPSAPGAETGAPPSLCLAEDEPNATQTQGACPASAAHNEL